MSEEENKRLFEHYKSLSEGSMKTGNPVRDELISMKTGNPVRDELIKSDGAKHLADLIKKNPNLIVEKVEEVEEPKEFKSKGKK